MTEIGPSIRTVYLLSLLILVALTASLPIISIDIHTSSPAIIRPAAEVSTIRSPMAGTIDSVLVRDNDTVIKGQLLLVINHNTVDLTLSSLHGQMAEASAVIDDLHTALQHASKPNTEVHFQTASYRQTFNTYSESRNQAVRHLNRVKAFYQRQQILFQTKVIAAQEFEQHEFDFQQAQHQLKEIEEENRTNWENELHTQEIKVRELHHQINNLQWQRRRHFVYATHSGTLQMPRAIYAGTYVAEQEEVLRLSPDTVLHILALLPVNSIPILKPGMPVTLQVDAFHHQQWGLAAGKVVSIAAESKLIGDRWIYEVHCSLNQPYLRHGSGSIGQLRKGMTGIAHFQRGSFTVWELMRMKVDDVVNPYSHKPD